MENCDDHDYCRVRRARKPAAHRVCTLPCCRDDQVPQRSAPTARLPKKRKRTSVARPGPPEVVPTPQPFTPAGDMPGLLGLVPRPSASIPPAELPVVSKVTPEPQPPSAALHDDGPLIIHNLSVEEYQRIYHEVVDPMLTFKNGRPRPYSLDLGRRIKQKLWERLDRPTLTSSVGEDGLVRVETSYGVGVYPPLYDVDTLGEPKPGTPPNKRAKKR